MAGSRGAGSRQLGPVDSVGQIRALLTHALLPRGKAARIGALLKHGSYVSSFRSPLAGRLTIAWEAPSGASGAGAKRVRIAQVKTSFAKAARVKVKIVLTAKGKKLLGRTRHLRAIGSGSFVVTRSLTVRGQRAFKLGR